jgi:YidC/Oxa1 family membrane protein insertase
MDQKRLFLAIALSIGILVLFQTLVGRHLTPPPRHTTTTETAEHQPTATPAQGSPGAGAAQATSPSAPKNVPRIKISAARLKGSISLMGARIDDVVLTDYRETLAPDSPLVQLLEPRSETKPYYVQYGWSAADPGIKLPDNDTIWQGSGDTLSTGKPVTLSWDNGQGLTFQLILSVDDNYMFAVDQRVQNNTGAPVQLFPWSRICRDYTPAVSGYYILFEGLLGVSNGTLQETTYAKAKSEGEKHDGVAFTATAPGGWAGIWSRISRSHRP